MNPVLTALRWTGAVLLALFLIPWLILGLLYWRAHDALPRTQGELIASGAQAPISIVRDERGVPLILAESERDAAFAMGFAHAQDRLFQMHVTRWYLRGEIAAVLGAAAAQSDAQMRTYGLGRAADALAAALTPAEIAPLQAYADGVNAAMRARGFTPPLEFLMLGVAPSEWTAADSVLVYKGLAFDLIAGQAFRAPGRARLHQILGPDLTAQFLPSYPEDGPIALSARALGLTTPDAPASAAQGTGDPNDAPPEGSNNWVVSGAHTQSGLPLLAGDPHLSFRAPGTWYLAAQRTPSGEVVGATVPGAPSIVLGRNGFIAWAMTNTSADVADLVFAAETDVIEEWEETIAVRFGAPSTVTIHRTADGAVLPPDLFPQGALAPEGRIAVLRWTLDDPQDRTVTVGAMLNAATDWADFEAALARFHVPMQNIVFASWDGRIGFIAPGAVPIRDAAGNWTGTIPFDELPRAIDPPGGIIVSANNRITPPDYPYTLTETWAEPHRARRIADLLAETDSHTPESFMAIQLDAVDLGARRILPALAGAAPETDSGRAALALLAGWDGDMRADAAEPLIYAAWMRQLSRAIYEDDLGPDFALFHAARTPFMESVLAGPNAHWCDDIRTPGTETCLHLAGPALDRAMAELESAHGADRARWRWGDAHRAYFPHVPFAQFPVLDGIFSSRIPVPGSGVTVNVAGFSYAQPGFDTTHGAGFRAIYDLSNLEASLYAMPLGQSGHVVSPHYRDLLEPWARGEYFPIRTDFSPDDPPPGARVLRLLPDHD